MAALFSTFNKKTEIGYMPQNYILDGLNKSTATADKYNGILMDLGIIGIIKSRPHYFDDGRLVRIHNVYYRPENMTTAIKCSKYIYEPDSLDLSNRVANTKEDI